MFDRVAFKERSKEQLCGRWGFIGALNIILFILYLAIQFIPTKIYIFVFMLLEAPILLAQYTIALKVSRYQEVKIEDIFSGFKSFIRAFGLHFWIFFWTFLWGLLLIIPGIVKGYSYSMAFYILIDHPEMTIREALKESIAITDGHKMDLFILSISFLGWELVSILTLGIGYFWLTSYSSTSLANAYEAIKRV